LRTEVSGAVVAGRLHIVGAFPGSSGVPGQHEAYDPATDTWTKLAPAPADLNHVGAVELHGKLYAIGGWSRNILPVATAYRYDPVTDSWTTLKPMPTARASPATIVYQNKIFVIGGNIANGGFGEIGVVEAYDTVTDTWTTGLAPLPTPRDHAMYGALSDGLLHVVGGRARDYGGAMTHHEAYNPATNTWISRAPLPTGRSGGAATVFRGRLHVLGGEFGPNGTQDTHEAYNPVTNTWSTLAPMLTARHGLGVGAIGDRIYAASGGRTPGASYSDILESFTLLEPCSPRPRVTVQSAPAGLSETGRMSVVVGATTNAGTTSNHLQRFQVMRAVNAAVDIRSLVDQRQAFLLDLPDRPATLELVVQRVTAGPFAVHLTVEDDCGPWPTFFGAGAGAR
jgi:hypothetical protein